MLTQPGMAEEVAAVIRGWQNREPRELWNELKAQGWGEMETAEEVGAWGYVSANAFRVGEPESGWCVHANGQGFDGAKLSSATLASRVEAVARWLVAAGWAYRQGYPESGYADSRAEPRPITATDTMGGGSLTTSGVASRLRPWPAPVRVHHGSALDVPIPDDCADCVVYSDPSYKHPDGTPTTGYAQNIYAEDLRPYLLEWARRGATVAISDARPNADLMGEGWVSFEIGSERVGQRRTFGPTDEWLTMNREPAWRPGRQVGLFG